MKLTATHLGFCCVNKNTNETSTELWAYECGDAYLSLYDEGLLDYPDNGVILDQARQHSVLIKHARDSGWELMPAVLKIDINNANFVSRK